MRRFALFALPALVLACTPDDGTLIVDDSGPDTEADTDTDTDTDTDADTDVECEDEIDYLDPGNGTVDVSSTPTLRAWLTEGNPDADVTFELTGPDGDVTGQVANSNGGAQWTFTPDDELSRSQEYTFLASVCGDSSSSTFETVAGPIDESALVGRSYDINLNDVSWNSPDQTVGVLLLGYIDTDHVMVNVDAVDSDADTITTIGAMASAPNGTVEQDVCVDVIPFDPADFSGNPYFQAGPSSTTIGAGRVRRQRGGVHRQRELHRRRRRHLEHARHRVHGRAGLRVPGRRCLHGPVLPRWRLRGLPQRRRGRLCEARRGGPRSVLHRGELRQERGPRERRQLPVAAPWGRRVRQGPASNPASTRR